MNPYITSPEILSLLQNYGYPVMFLLMIIEGPIVTYISAFAASLQIFNVYIVFFLSIIGNFLSDLFYFSIGRLGNKAFLHKHVSKPKYRYIKRLKNHLENNTGMSVIIIKSIVPLSAAGLVVTGMANVSFKRFSLIAFLTGIPFALIFTFAGFYSGIAFDVFSRYLKRAEIGILIAVVVFVLIWLLYNKLSKIIVKKVEKKLKI